MPSSARAWAGAGAHTSPCAAPGRYILVANAGFTKAAVIEIEDFDNWFAAMFASQVFRSRYSHWYGRGGRCVFRRGGRTVDRRRRSHINKFKILNPRMRRMRGQSSISVHAAVLLKRYPVPYHSPGFVLINQTALLTEYGLGP